MIYIHVPFCRSFCTYCDFYSEIAPCCRNAHDSEAQSGLFDDFSHALGREISLRGHEITDDTDTLYIGGGTPSVLPLSVFEAVLKALEDSGHGGPYAEFTVEVNPDDILQKGHSYVEGLLELGVNRVSMGVQSLDDATLRWMNRRHDSDMARKAYGMLEEAGVENISIDLIFGLSGMAPKQWEDTLAGALDLSSRGSLPRHVSAYQLSVEPGSMLARMQEEGRWTEATEEECAQQYEVLCRILSERGYRHYEVSNFALPGYEALHNSAYWRHEPYSGFGPGAHSFLVGGAGDFIRKWNEPDLNAYLKAAAEGDFSRSSGGEVLTAEQIVLEKLMLGLRTDSGIPQSLVKDNCISASVKAALAKGNLVRTESGCLRIPEDRFFISDSIIAGLI